VVASAVAVLGVVSTVYTIWGPPWPTNPEIRPRDVIDGSSFVLPFTVRNPSAVFDMDNVEFTCGVDLVHFEDAEGKTGGLSDVAFVTGHYSISANSSINYPCDASGIVQILTDGSLTLRNSLSTKPGVFRPPLKVLTMCLWIGGDYKLMGLTRRFTSTIFDWIATPAGHQWLEGPVAHEMSAQYMCSPAVRTPYMLIKGSAPPVLVMSR
jgi:hypothetical protein